MTNDSGRQQRFLIKRRRWPLVLTGLALCILAVWPIAGYFLDAALYKPMLVRSLANATGLPVSVGSLNIDVFPVSCVRATQIEIGEGDFHASVQSVKATVRLRDLLTWNITLPEIEINGASVIVPQTLKESSEKYHALKFVTASEPKTKGTRVSIGVIHTEGAALYRGVGTAPFARVDVEVREPVSASTAVKIRSELPSFGPSPRVTTDLTLSRGDGQKGITGIQGTVQLEGVRLDELVEGEGAPKATLVATVTVDGKSPEDVALAISGQVTPEPGEPAAVEAIAGPFTAKAWWQSGKFIVNDLNWHSPGLTWTGDFTRSPEGEIACNFPEVSFNEASLGPMLALLPKSDIRLRSTSGAALKANDLLLGVSSEGQFRLVKGEIAFSGVEVDHKGIDVLSHVHGDLRLEEGTVRVTKLAADGITLSGTIRPDLTARSATIDLSGQADITRKRISPFVELASVPKLEGAVAIKRIAATIIPGAGIPADLVIEGTIAKGSLEVDTPQFRDSVSGIKADFVTRPDSIDTKINASSKMLGPIACDGAYQFKTGTWEGTITTDAPRVVSAFLKSDDQRRKIGPIVAAYGEAPLQVSCVFPKGKTDALAISATRTADPTLRANIRFSREKDGLALGAVTASTQLPATAFSHLLPAQVVTTGAVPISFNRSAEEHAFRVDADLTPCTIAAGSYLSKKEGAQAKIEVLGEASPGNWTAHTLQITLLGQQAQGRMTADNIEFDKLDLQLDSLAGLFTQGAKVNGRITGTAATAPLKLDLALDNVGFYLKPELGLDSVSGSLAFAGGKWNVRDLRIQSANSDCTIAGKVDANGWHGKLTGAKIDLNAIQALSDEAKAFSATKEKTKETSGTPSTFTGDLAVDVESIYYRRARIDKVHGDVQFLPGVTHVRNVRAQPYSGWITGAADAVSAKGESPAYLDLDLTLDTIDAKIIDAVSTKPPRDFSGALSGKARLRFPTGEGVEPINGATGTVHITGQSGSLGKMGFATKALAVLRATELIRLRMPSLRDEGLVFDTLTCSISMDNGVMTIEKFDLVNTSLSAEAEGTLDFPRLQSDVRIHVHPLESVTGLVQEVPVLGKAVNEVTKQGGLLLVAKGSPYEPTVRFEGTGATEGVKDVTVKGGSALKDTVKKTAGDAINRLLGR